ncbi:hypothetical protein LguiB_026324 [Lonicera macranthoides]
MDMGGLNRVVSLRRRTKLKLVGQTEDNNSFSQDAHDNLSPRSILEASFSNESCFSWSQYSSEPISIFIPIDRWVLLSVLAILLVGKQFPSNCMVIKDASRSASFAKLEILAPKQSRLNMSSIDAATDRRISESRLTGRMPF